VESKILFNQLLSALTTEDSKDEKESLVYWVMQNKLGVTRSDILANKQVKAADEVFVIIKRLNGNEPLQYILGEAEFFGRSFLITPDVLIPRPETELLVLEAMQNLKSVKNPSIIDIGAGSGCIGVTLAIELPQARVVATDVSSSALAVAEQNASRLGATLITQLHNILLEPLDHDALDAVVSNPPYVLNSERPAMQKRVVEFEPGLALFVSDSDPLQFHKVIADKATHSLAPGGFIALEINERLGKASASTLTERGFNDVRIIKDLDQKDRIVSGRKAS
jgi:release factor glutamine methyltransferase